MQVLAISRSGKDWHESVDLLHSKSKNRARRVEKSTASVKTPTKHTLPSPARQPSKRDRKRSIDYKQLHEEGVYEEKKTENRKLPPPKAVDHPSYVKKLKNILCKTRKHQNTMKPVKQWQPQHPRNMYH